MTFDFDDSRYAIRICCHSRAKHARPSPEGSHPPTSSINSAKYPARLTTFNMPPNGSSVTTVRQSAGALKGPDRDSINDTWEYLAGGITKIMTDLDNGMTMEDVSR